MSKKIEVLVPTLLGGMHIREALASCAIEGNQFAIDALETIRRVEAGEPVGLRYVESLNEFMRQCASDPSGVPTSEPPRTPDE